MKKIVFILLLLSLYVIVRSQQDTRIPLRTPEYEAERGVEVMRRELSLTDQQVDTIYKIHLKYAVLRRAVYTKEEHTAQMKCMTEEIKGVLTPEQIEILMNQVVRHPNKPFHSTRQIRQENSKDTAVVELTE